MIITKTERYEFYKNQLKKYKTKKEKIEYLEQLKFLIEMIDKWTDFDKVSFDAVCELINEVKNKNEKSNNSSINNNSNNRNNSNNKFN